MILTHLMHSNASPPPPPQKKKKFSENSLNPPPPRSIANYVFECFFKTSKWWMKINSMSHSKSGLSCIYSPLIANRDFYWKHTMIKATQYFIDICWITEFDAKNGGWLSQDLRRTLRRTGTTCINHISAITWIL